MDKKMTKKEYYEILKEIVRGDADSEVTVEQSELLDFLDKQIDIINTKAEKAKARAAEKKAEGDALRDAVQVVLTDEPQTIDEIVEKVDFEDATKAKITARLTALCKTGIAEKQDVKTEDNRTLKAYNLAA